MFDNLKDRFKRNTVVKLYDGDITSKCEIITAKMNYEERKNFYKTMFRLAKCASATKDYEEMCFYYVIKEA